MIKFLLHTYLATLMLLEYLFLIIKMLLFLPKAVFDEVVRSFRYELTQMPHKIRKHFPYYDTHGLKHSTEYLQSIRIDEMIKWTFEEQAEYADKIVVNFCKEGASSEFEHEIHYMDINATSIGNAAYIILNHPSLEEREKAYQVMNKIEKLITENH